MSEKIKQEDLSKVIEEMEQKCVEKPDSVMAHHNLGLVYRKAERFDDAVVELEKAIEGCSGSTNIGAVIWRHGELAVAR